MSIGLLPTPVPSRNMTNSVFVQAMNNFIAALPQFVNDTNALAAGLNALAQGGAYAIPYNIDLTSISDTDPGSGFLRFNNATQNLSTVLRMDVTGSDNVGYTSLIDTFDGSTSAVKGVIKITKQGDFSKFLTYNVTARTSMAGFRDITVTCVGSSSANPFAQGDSALMSFTRNGDMGSPGTNGSLIRRVTSVASDTTPTPNLSTTDLYEITALAANCTFSAPTGTAVNGASLMYRVKDNGVARTFSFTSNYRAPIELPFPSGTVVGKWTYLGFIYNATDSKWDMVSAISNM